MPVTKSQIKIIIDLHIWSIYSLSNIVFQASRLGLVDDKKKKILNNERKNNWLVVCSIFNCLLGTYLFWMSGVLKEKHLILDAIVLKKDWD